jgi:hypothetical protein
MELDQHIEYPTLHIERLSEREREVVAAVLEDRLRELFELVMRADNASWDDFLTELAAEEVAGEGVIRSRLGMMSVLRRAVGASPFAVDDLDFLRRVGE